jgi:hypothetical protein
MNLGWLGQRGPPPTLADSEVIIMEVVGAFAGLQEANLGVIRQRRRLWNQLPQPGAGWLGDSVPLYFCQCVRARRCRQFRRAAVYGYDARLPQTFYGKLIDCPERHSSK